MFSIDRPARRGFFFLFGLFSLPFLLPSLASAERPLSSPLRPNIIVISMDSTRADHLSLYGYALPTTPHLDRFAENAMVFENASTVVPLTGPSHASLFTSLYPHRHGAFRNGIPLPDSYVTLAEHLREYGYDTASFVSGWTLRSSICGLEQGFDHYDDRIPHRYKLVNRERFAEETNQAVFSYLDRRSRGETPLFLFVHYFDPHDPYRKRPETWDAMKRASAELRSGGRKKTPEKVLAYDSEIAYMDREIGRLFQRLETRGLLDNAVVLILADHGESLGEHGYWGHGRRVYEQMIRVPVILRLPGQVSGGRIREPVSTLDLLPTLLSLAGLPLPKPLPPEGRDLSGLLLEGTSLPPDRIYFETFKGTIKRFTKLFARKLPKAPLLVGYKEADRKWILCPETSAVQSYDLASDPGETNNLSAHSSDEALATDLTAWYNSGIYTGPVRARLSREEIEQMKSLGYID